MLYSQKRMNISFYSILRSTFRLIPRKLRVFLRTAIGERRVSRIVSRIGSHGSIDDAEFYEFIDRTASESAPVIAESIIELFDPQSVLDVGCGTGALLHELRKRDIAETGVEYSEEALKYCRERDLDVMRFDLESDTDPFPDRKFDVVVSMEVAEHLPERIANKFVDLICEHGDCFVFTAAPPGQGGINHVNEQPQGYWIDKFHTRGFQFLEEQSTKWRHEWKNEEVSWWYSQNLMLFRKSPV